MLKLLFLLLALGQFYEILRNGIGKPYFICDLDCYLTVLIEAQEGLVTQFTRFSKSQQDHVNHSKATLKLRLQTAFQKPQYFGFCFALKGIILFV